MKYYFPDLNYWFRQYWLTYGDITVSQVSLPVIDDNFIDNSSIFALLFNIGFGSTSYNLNFSRKAITSMQSATIDRLSIYGGFSNIYIGDDEGEQIISFFDADILMFDTLLSYRLFGDCDISEIDYNSLNTVLSKQIYMYIDVLMNQVFEYVDTIGNLQPTNILEYLFGIFVNNEMHRYIKFYNVYLESSIQRLYPIRRIFSLTSDEITNGEITVSGYPNERTIYVYLDGELLEKDVDYTVNFSDYEEYDMYGSYDDSEFTIYWTSNSFKEGSILIIDFYTIYKEDPYGGNIYTVFVDKLKQINKYKKDRTPWFYVNTETNENKDSFFYENTDLYDTSFDPNDDRIEDAHWYEYMRADGNTSEDD